MRVPKTARRFIVATLAAAIAPLVLTGPASAVRPDNGPRLPAPSGPLRIGTSSAEFVDTGRTDPWQPDAGARRLMVTIWYPTAQRSGRTAPYASPELAQAMLPWDYPNVPNPARIHPERVRTNAFLDARPAPTRAGRPLVILSPGFELSRVTLTPLAEDLASHGFVVAAVDHPYEAPVQLADGTVLPCAICGTRDPAVGARVVTSRVQDLHFLIGALEHRYAGLIDSSRVAVAGHSIGGAAAVTAMLTDTRLRAAANLDGSFFEPLPQTQDGRSVLLFGDASDVTPAWDAGWSGVVPSLPGPTYWLGVTGVGHYTYVDTTWMLDVFGVRSSVPPADGLPRYGTRPGTRTIAITRAYLLAFFQNALQDRAPGLLIQPSKQFPEVEYRASP